MTNTISALEYSNDIINAFRWVGAMAPNVKRKGWPYIERVLRRCSRCTNESQVQAVW